MFRRSGLEFAGLDIDQHIRSMLSIPSVTKFTSAHADIAIHDRRTPI
jgi:hypothetical protein